MGRIRAFELKVRCERLKQQRKATDTRNANRFQCLTTEDEDENEEATHSGTGKKGGQEQGDPEPMHVEEDKVSQDMKDECMMI